MNYQKVKGGETAGKSYRLKQKSSDNILIIRGLFFVLLVTATGFKPVTPTSVVWYSIQLSYAAIFL